MNQLSLRVRYFFHAGSASFALTEFVTSRETDIITLHPADGVLYTLCTVYIRKEGMEDTTDGFT